MSSVKGINPLGEIQSIKTKLIAVIAGASVVTALCMGGFFIFSQIQANHQQLDHYRETLEKNVESSLKGETQVAYYDRSKIYNAIAGAAKEIPDSMTDEEKESITNQVENTIANLSSITVEEIQDVVEQVLMKQGFFDVAKHYIMYRQRHAERREAQKNLMKSYKDIFFADAIDSDMKRDNANINTDASMGIMLKLGA